MAKICPRCSELAPEGASFCPHDGAALHATRDPFLGKTIAARYRLTKQLGSGGMSLVYLAHHEIIRRQSAIKILRPELSQNPEHRERFLREARAVNRINHENIVEITDVGESDGIAYLVMEYVEGASLLQEIQEGPLDWERAVRIVMTVASALARAHQAGVIHRDLKPENILLVPRPGEGGASEVIKLTDFGIAKMSGEPTLTLNQQLFGTPGYIPPEHVAGVPLDGRADIYSLAVVLYEMITGVLPFEGRGQSDLLLLPLTKAPVPPSRRVAGLPSELEALILRCLARDPDERPHDAFALRDALADVLRRHGDASGTRASNAPGEASGRDSREPMATVIDRPRLSEREIADVGRMAVAMSARWLTSSRERLAALEANIEAARAAGGAFRTAAGRAAELALVAGEMIGRIERGASAAGELQANVGALEIAGREFRARLGHAIDVLVHDRSRERAHRDALHGRRRALAQASAGAPNDPRDQAGHTGHWEAEALAAEELRAERVVDDLTFQIDALQRQLDQKNEEHELALLHATGKLEGSLSALRRLTKEVALAIDEALSVLRAPQTGPPR